MKNLKLIMTLLICGLSSMTFAKNFINCYSTQTQYTYHFYPESNYVEILNEGTMHANAEIKFTAGQGEDILYSFYEDNFRIGTLNGEEGTIRGSFSHQIFESNLVDEALTCKNGRYINCLGKLSNTNEVNLCKNVQHPNHPGMVINCAWELGDAFEINVCEAVKFSKK